MNKYIGTISCGISGVVFMYQFIYVVYEDLLCINTLFFYIHLKHLNVFFRQI